MSQHNEIHRRVPINESVESGESFEKEKSIFKIKQTLFFLVSESVTSETDETDSISVDRHYSSFRVQWEISENESDENYRPPSPERMISSSHRNNGQINYEDAPMSFDDFMRQEGYMGASENFVSMHIQEPCYICRELMIEIHL